VFSSDSLSLDSLKKNRYILERLLWDFEPSQLMRSSAGKTGEGSKRCASGYLFYIETMGKHPALFLMAQNAGGYAETLAKIDGVPEHLIQEAIQENRGKEYFKMYPIGARLKEWLKRELG